MPRSVVLSLLAVAAAVAAPVPKALKRPPPTLDGRWEAVTMNRGGADVSRANPTVWDVKGDTVTRYYREPDGTLRADPTTAAITRPDPNRRDEIDYSLTGPNAMLFRARLAVSPDEFTIRFAEQDAPRPVDLSEGPDGWYYRFKRVGDK